MKSPGPTEIRVRAALLRLWDKRLHDGEDTTEMRWSDFEVRREVESRDGAIGRASVQGGGRRMVERSVAAARGSAWAPLGDDTEATYERGVFRVRKRLTTPLDEHGRPKVWVPPHRDANGSLGGHWAVDHSADKTDVHPDAEPQKRTPGNAWVEIHGAMMFCPCGHASDFTDRDFGGFCSRAEATCEGCGTRWGTPSAADCERLDGDDSPEPPEPRVTQRQLDMMRHATGRRLDRERNHYCAVPDTDPYAGWEELVSMGLAVRSDVGEGSATYQVTEAGFRMVYGAKRRKR